MVRFRIANADDAEAIAALHTYSWRRTYRGSYSDAFLDGDLLGNRCEVWRERFARPRVDQFVCVAEDDARVVGFVCAYGAEDPEWGSLIDNLHVERDQHRKGIASALMRRAGTWLTSSYNERGVYLWVLEVNAGARRFYETLRARNAGVVEMTNASGATDRSCRYVWESPEHLTD